MHFALLAYLYPVNFFYYFLFYTDTASTLSILIVLYLAQPLQEIEFEGEQKAKREQVNEDSLDMNDKSWRCYRPYSLHCFYKQSILLIVSYDLALLILQNASLCQISSFWKNIT